MNKVCNVFLIITFSITYLCFGLIFFSKVQFPQIWTQPQFLFLFVLGCISPLIATIIVYAIKRDELGGVRALFEKLKTIDVKAIYLIFFFLAVHYGSVLALRAIVSYRTFSEFIILLPIMALLFGTQEIGWRLIVQPAYEEKKGFGKSCIITALLCSMWFMPLMFVPKFLVHPDFFAQFAAYLVAFSFLQTTLYKQSGSILYCMIFASIFYALAVVLAVQQTNILLLTVVVDIIIAYTYHNNKLRNTKAS